MHALGLIALILQTGAAVWSITLIRKSRDWRYGMFVALLFMLAARRLLYPVWNLTANEEDSARTLMVMDVVLALLVSIFSIAVVWQLRQALRLRDEEERDLRLLAGTLSDSSVAVLITDAGRGATGPSIVFVNDAMSRMTGYPREELMGRSPDVLLAPGAERAPVDRLRSDHTNQRGFLVELPSRRRDGSDYWVSWSVSPVRSEKGAVSHFMLVQHDITERRTAQTALSQALEKLSFHVNNSPLGVIEWDEEFRVMFWSAGAERMFGWSALDVVGKRPEEWDIIFDADRTAVGEVIARLMDGRDSRNLSSNRNLTLSGDVIDCEWYNSALRTPEGRLVSILSLVRDVTDRRRTEDHQRLMMRELDHRVKNNLAAVAGIAERTLDASGSLDEFRASFLGRIDAMSRAHGVLARSNWTGVGLGALVSQVLAPYSERLDLSGPEVMLRAAEGTILAMVFHELGVNAAKYGALAAGGGRIGVCWRVDGSGERSVLEVDWSETGGPPVRSPARSGFGTEFIREAVSYELKGSAEITYESSGLACRLKVPLPSRRRAEQVADDLAS